MDTHLFIILAQKYLDGTASADERDVVEGYWEVLSGRPVDELTDESVRQVVDEMREAVFASIQSPGKLVPLFKRAYIKYAVAVVFLFAVAATWLLVADKPTPAVTYSGNVAPGKMGSKIKLSDGRIVMLDTLQDGLIAIDGAMRIVKKDGKILYEGKTDQVIYNEVFAEKGRESEAVVLPDGSTAWLNAGSSLRYPLHFVADLRMVTMTGEVYFEVVHNEKQPFRVIAGNQTIEDLGTSFNVNAYHDEASVVTTLVDGRIKIQGKILKPGQQYKNGNVEAADVEQATAWHKGLFSFQHADIPTVMRQMARWYNVEIKYEGAIPDESFTGDMERNLSLADALDYLKRMHVRFRIEEDKRIVVMQ